MVKCTGDFFLSAKVIDRFDFLGLAYLAFLLKMLQIEETDDSEKVLGSDYRQSNIQELNKKVSS